tara:strand:+ start:347 stop:868 length:522 start_codon:yes stop_codon:yes gene_type:complete
MTNGLYKDLLTNVAINEAITDNVLKCWDEYKNNPLNLIKVDSTCTFEGIQTSNVLKLSDFQSDYKFQGAINNTLEIVQHLIGKTLHYYHIHLIEYHSGGYQAMHNHAHNEDYSYILYLNTCKGGETYFESGISCKPQKNNLLVFEATVNHGANETHACDNKSVLVAGMRKKND